MSERDRDKWNHLHGESKAEPREPSWFLPWLPNQGRDKTALDVACGRGGASLALCREGYSLTALDISEVGLDSLEKHAKSAPVVLKTQRVDLEEPLPSLPYFTLIHCAHYLDYALFEKLGALLVPGGRLLTEHHGTKNLERHAHPSERFLIDPETLAKSLFSLTQLTESEAWHGDRFLYRSVWERPSP